LGQHPGELIYNADRYTNTVVPVVNKWLQQQTKWNSQPRGFPVSCPASIQPLFATQMNKSEVILLSNVWVQLQVVWTNQPRKFKECAMGIARSLANKTNEIASVERLLEYETSLSIYRPIVPKDIVSTQRVQALFAMVTDLSIPKFCVQKKDDSNLFLMVKWNTMNWLHSYIPCLRNSQNTWVDCANFIGDVRANIVQEYDAVRMNISVFDVPYEKRDYILSLKDWSLAMNEYQDQLIQTSNRWTRYTLELVREFASKLPPEKRKVFLDEIARRAKSDAKEIELLNKPLL
jgi:hypothetical protein